MTPFDPSSNYLAVYPHPLDALFQPKSIALIGAKDTPGSFGCTIMKNLLEGGVKSSLYPINPHRSSVLGKTCYQTIREVPEEVDLAIVVIPAPLVPEALEECVERQVKTCIIISAGFKEVGASGKELEERVVSIGK